MIPDFSGDFISAKSVKDGDMLEILDEGKYEYSENLKKEVFNLKVNLNGKPKTWSPNNKHGKILQLAFGPDSKAWINQKVQVVIIEDQMLIKPIVKEKIK